MSHDTPEDALTLKELSDENADATGTTADAIEHGVEELEIVPPPSRASVTPTRPRASAP